MGMLLLIVIVGCNPAEPKTAAPPSTAPEPGVISVGRKYTNRLVASKSPYLLQHAQNPVDWYPWGEAAFAKARQENKPIFLSVGYSTCHWCHVMERESFENEAIAKIMNEHFICIKVDREERPDVDRVYMKFVQATTGGGGWPMNVWLTPDLKPFFGGTYFPPDTEMDGADFRPPSRRWLRRGAPNASKSLHQASKSLGSFKLRPARATRWKQGWILRCWSVASRKSNPATTRAMAALARRRNSHNLPC